jgi:ubiquinone/menaquinone biosynthesis C-methylase UbiE
MSNLKQQLQTIRFAYDQTVEDYFNDIHEIDLLPEEFKQSPAFRRFQSIAQECNSGAPEIYDFLYPTSGMHFLDIGSCANLMGYELHRWPSVYFGLDISFRLIQVTQMFAEENRFAIGGLCVAEASQIPFEDAYFEIASVIGVLEYYDLDYATAVLKELYRILKDGGKAVIDFPNLEHPEFETMIQYEAYLGRPRFNLPTYQDFEMRLRSCFKLVEVDRESLMIQYYVSK